MESNKTGPNQEPLTWQRFVGIAGLLVLVVFFATSQVPSTQGTNFFLPNTSAGAIGDIENRVLPKEGVKLPVQWRDMGMHMVEAGVIDAPRFEALFSESASLVREAKELLYGSNTGNVVMTRENAGVLLDLFWAFGLSNKNMILERGPLVDSRYGGEPERFASIGGWSLAVGNAMDHYNRHQFISLTDEQQEKVENVAKGIYRPCCGNATYFPDCNHGMAMLGLLEMLAQNGMSEEEMYESALAVNAYWFPEAYLSLAVYFEQKGIPWDSVDPRVVLGINYSSSSGYQRILQEVESVGSQGGGTCSV